MAEELPVPEGQSMVCLLESEPRAVQMSVEEVKIPHSGRVRHADRQPILSCIQLQDGADYLQLIPSDGRREFL